MISLIGFMGIVAVVFIGYYALGYLYFKQKGGFYCECHGKQSQAATRYGQR